MKLEVLHNQKFYHIYNRGINGCDIFTSDENKRYFLQKIKDHTQEVLNVYAYCLMNNHFHLIVQVVNEDLVIQKLSNVFNAYAKAFNKQEKRTGSLFEKHFRRKELNNESYLRNLILYVHLNPKKHFNLDYTQYKYTSYSTMVSDKPTLLKRNEVVKIFDSLENFVNSHSHYEDKLEEGFTFE